MIKGLLKTTLLIFAPIITVATGGGLFYWGMPESQFLMWTGGIVALAGLIWGILMYVFASDGLL